MFECFIEGCEIKFQTKKERDFHLKEIHKIELEI